MSIHPNQALFEGEKQLPIIPTCEHFAGSEKLIRKAAELQHKLGKVFDITCDCEDGAEAGQEVEHAQMICRLINSEINIFDRLGVRIHDYSHKDWKQDVDILVPEIGNKLAYITIPKSSSYKEAREMTDYIRKVAEASGIQKPIPIHILIETHGALRDIEEIAGLPNLEVLDFGLMDFVSSYKGAISDEKMRSPGQFEHNIIRQAKTKLTTAALAQSVIPAHNVTLDIKNPYQTYADAKRAKDEFGFLRMWSVYPSQVTAIVDAMKPDFSQLADAQNILLAAHEVNWGPIQYKRELHDRATYRYYWVLVQKAKSYSLELKPEVLAFFNEGAENIF